MQSFEYKENYSTEDLVKIVAMLRAEDGCPWDKVQTHETIRNNFIEEVYEVCDAIDKKDKDALCEELGDVLLQVVFHTQMEQEKGGFDLNDVADGICKKLILRHPHIFADVEADTEEKVLDNWDKIKMEEKGQQSYTDTLKSVPAAFPALMRAAKVQKRAGKANFDWDNVYDPLLKIGEELAELEESIEDGCACHIAEELGDLLFAVVNVSRFVKVDAEQALQSATDKFVKRFEKVENVCRERGIDMKSSTLEELDAIWDKIKH